MPLVVDQAALGTALGIMTSIQMIGIGLCNFAIGGILDKWKYENLNFAVTFLFDCFRIGER